MASRAPFSPWSLAPGKIGGEAGSSLQACFVGCAQCVYRNKNESPVLKWGGSHELGQPGLKGGTAVLRTGTPR